MNTRPVVLVVLLLVLVITSQFEWKQHIGDAADADPAAPRWRQQLLGRDDAVKEKIRVKSVSAFFFVIAVGWVQSRFVWCAGKARYSILVEKTVTLVLPSTFRNNLLCIVISELNLGTY
jgi:hypothetical protein